MKPTDKAIIGMVNESQSRNASEPTGGFEKKLAPEAEPSLTGRRQHGTSGADRCGMRLHGNYYRWTGFVGGKRTTKTISKEMAWECIRCIRSYRRSQRDLATLLRKALAETPWTSRSPLPQRKSKRS